MPSSNTTMRTQCPVGYEPVEINDSVDCPVIEDVLSENNSSSLWLIKVPHDFDVSSLSGQTVVLNGSQDLLHISGKNKDKRYEIQSKQQTSSELSSFSVVLPSLREKSLCASSLHGQMSVIQSVSVPPATLPETSDSLTVQKQTHSEYIKKWKPFGYRKPQQRKLKGIRAKEPAEHLEEGLPGRRKKHKEKANVERAATVGKKDEGRQEFDSSQMNDETGLDRTRKRKGDQKSKTRQDENGLTPAKQKMEKSGINLAGNVVVKRESNENDTRVTDMNEVDNGHDFTRVKRESGETSKKTKKHKKNKTGKHEKKESERTSHSFSYDGFI